MDLADAHAHFFSNGYRSPEGTMFPRGAELILYRKFRRFHGIKAVLAVGYEGEPRYAGNNRYLGEIAAARRWIHPLAYCPPDRPPSARELNRWMRQRFAGISLYLGTPAAAASVAAWPEEICTLLNAARCIVSVNAPMTVVSRLRPFAERIPRAKLLLSHLGLPGILPDPISSRAVARKMAPLRALAELPNIGVKASGFYACGSSASVHPHPSCAPVFAFLLEHLGARRLFWGSDFSPALGAVSFRQTVEVMSHFSLPAPERRAIMGGNLLQLLHAP